MQEELFGVEFNLWMKHKETHKVGRVIENEAVVSGCLSRAKFSLHTRTLFRDLISLPSQIVPAVRTRSVLPQITRSPLPPPQWMSSPSGRTSPYLSSQKQLVLPQLRSRSAKKKGEKKKKNSSLIASGCGESDAGLSA